MADRRKCEPAGRGSGKPEILKLIGRRWKHWLLVSEGSPELVRSLLAAGAQVDAGNGSGMTPLHLAALDGRKATAELLLSRGADIGAVAYYGNSALHFAAAIHGDESQNDSDLAELLLAKGASCRAIDRCGATPLHTAAETGQLKIAEALLKFGADVNAPDSTGRTPLDYATESNFTRRDDMLTLLRDHGGRTGRDIGMLPGQEHSEEFLKCFGHGRGYSSVFQGDFKLSKPLTQQHRAYLVKLNETRRMKRDTEKTARRKDPVREAVGLPVGPDGAYFVGAEGHLGQEHLPENSESSSQYKERLDRIGLATYDFNDPPGGLPVSASFLNLRASTARFVPLPARSTTADAIPSCFSRSPSTALSQPDLWCPWMPNEDGTAIIGDESEKFFDYVEVLNHFELRNWYDFYKCAEWVEYLIENFLEPWGYVLNGTVNWGGLDWDEGGTITAAENVVKADYR